MARPIIIAHHLIWTAYGWWRPNDPRGSGSHYVVSDVLKSLGELHCGRKKIQPARLEIREFYAQAAPVLKYPLLRFGHSEIAVIAESFAEVITKNRYTCYACAIMPDHVHLLIRKHKFLAEEMMGHFRNAARIKIAGHGKWSLDHAVFGGGGWKVFMDHPDEVRRTIKYIENNPVKEGMAPQHWRFVKVYDNWPLHQGHNPNSPYARRLGAKG
ncbi:MAG TPA: transposase [Tepidisphaeraceae bacterium]|jgi:REP element-mobilizing transposase RayT